MQPRATGLTPPQPSWQNDTDAPPAADHHGQRPRTLPLQLARMDSTYTKLVRTSPQIETSTRKPTPKAIRLDDVRSKQLRPVIEDMRKPAARRSVPSWDGCSLPVPRSPLGIMNGLRDHESAHKAPPSATNRHQAPPNASQGTSTPASRHTGTKTQEKLARDVYPRLFAPPSATSRHHAQPRATKRNLAPLEGTNSTPGTNQSISGAPTPTTPTRERPLPRASTNQPTAHQHLTWLASFAVLQSCSPTRLSRMALPAFTHGLGPFLPRARQMRSKRRKYASLGLYPGRVFDRRLTKDVSPSLLLPQPSNGGDAEYDLTSTNSNTFNIRRGPICDA